MSFFIGPSHQAEVIFIQEMTFEPDKLFGHLTFAVANDLSHSHFAVVVADPLWNTTNELKGTHMSFEKRFRALPRKGLNEDRIRIGQRHHEQRDLRQFTLQPGRLRHNGQSATLGERVSLRS